MLKTFSAALCLTAALGVRAAGAQAPTKLVFNEEQAARGALVYKNVCIECHENTEYTGADFRSKWNGRPVFDLYDLLRTTMPDGDPGTLSAQQYIDVVGYMMKLNAVPAGKLVLPTDADSLKKIKIEIPGKSPAPTRRQ